MSRPLPVRSSIFKRHTSKMGRPGGFAGADAFLGAKFRKQMAELMVELNNSNIFFIRCIKPNSDKEPQSFDPQLVLHQIQYLGVLDSIKIRKLGYPFRHSYNGFYEGFNILSPLQPVPSLLQIQKQGRDIRQICEQIIANVTKSEVREEQCLFGSTKIFLRTELLSLLEKRREIKLKERIAKAKKIQKFFRQVLSKRKFRKLRNSVCMIQRLWKNRLLIRLLSKKKKAARVIIRFFKTRYTRRTFIRQKFAARFIQTCLRRYIIRFRYLEMQRASVYIAKMVRGRRKRREYLKTRLVSNILQALALSVVEAVELFYHQSKCAENIQRVWRGSKCRSNHHRQVAQIQRKRKEIRRRRACIAIQRRVRGWSCRLHIANLHAKAKMIQGAMKAKWMYAIFINMRNACKKIQSMVRVFLHRKGLLLEELKTFVEDEQRLISMEQQYENNKILYQQFHQPNGYRANSPDGSHNGYYKEDTATTGSPASSDVSRVKRPHRPTPFSASSVIPFSVTASVSARGTVSPSSPFPSPSLRNGVNGLHTPENNKHIGRDQLHESAYRVDSSLDSPPLTPSASAAKGDRGWSDYKWKSTKKFDRVSKHTPSTYTTIEQSRVSLCGVVTDMHVLTDSGDSYIPSWARNYIDLQNSAKVKSFSIGGCHTLCVTDKGYVYSWGLNDKGQCANFNLKFDNDAINGTFEEDIYTPSEVRLPQDCVTVQTAAGADHSLALDIRGYVYSWGAGDKGQLGHGTKTDEYAPRKMLKLQHVNVNQIAAGALHNVALSKEGEVYLWPFEDTTGTVMAEPLKLFIHPKVKIAQVGCGLDFSLLLSTNGIVWSFGRRNHYGQLGVGDKEARYTPVMVKTLCENKEKISWIACGSMHCAVRSTLGRVYTWGWNAWGQLGLGHADIPSVPTPTRVKLLEKFDSLHRRVVQVACGWSHTVVIYEHSKVAWFGTNGILKTQFTPVEMPLWNKVGQVYPVRIECVWSATMSVTVVTAADLHSLKLSTAKADLVAKHILTSWLADAPAPPLSDLSFVFTSPAMVFKGHTKSPLRSPTKHANQDSTPPQRQTVSKQNGRPGV